jgi:hypothetical protein
LPIPLDEVEEGVLDGTKVALIGHLAEAGITTARDPPP